MKNFIYLLIFNLIISIDYNTQIQPIFDANCTSCHIGNFASGNLQLDTYENLMNGVDGEIVIVPGDHQNSILWQVIDSGEMPGYPNDDLDQSLINMIATWIDEGALNSVNCEDGFTYYQDIETLYPNVTIQDDGTCFKDTDLQTLNDIINVNDFDNAMNAFELGTQTWNDGRLRFLVAGYYFSGVEIPIHTLPESIGNLDDLRKLYLEENNITSLPDSFSNLTALVQLYISFNQLTSLPNDFGNLENLYILDLGYNSINDLPDSFLDLNSLTYLWLFNNELSNLPENFCSLDLNWDDDDYFGYPYFAIGGNMLCDDVPDCVQNSEHFNTSLDTYYYSVQITEEQECDFLENNDFTKNLKFGIEKIYPNPFNPITNIKFSIDEPENISISIYDIKGNLMVNLINAQAMIPGSYNIKWNGENVASGIYVVKISNGINSKNQKIILQK